MRSRRPRRVAPKACAALVQPLALAALVPRRDRRLRFSRWPSTARRPAQTLRVGHGPVQPGRLRATPPRTGTDAVVREVLDTHFAMTLRRYRPPACARRVLWSETVLPHHLRPPQERGRRRVRPARSRRSSTRPRCRLGVRHLRSRRGRRVQRGRVRAPRHRAAGLLPQDRPFPLTEYVPAGSTGRPAALAAVDRHAGGGDGRPGVPAAPVRRARDAGDGLICLVRDDTPPGDRRRTIGRRAILTMSNDSWFTGTRTAPSCSWRSRRSAASRTASAATPCHLQWLPAP